MIGASFGYWTVLSQATNSEAGKKRVLCRCVCGETRIVLEASLKRGLSKSCGCKANEQITDSLVKYHEDKDTDVMLHLRKVWNDMKYRCNNPKGESYHRYGGRGITYDTNWEYFMNFWEDMRRSYKEGLTIDRINNDGNYCKENCRWVDMKAQQNNRSDNLPVEKLLGMIIGDFVIEAVLDRHHADRVGSTEVLAKCSTCGSTKQCTLSNLQRDVACDHIKVDKVGRKQIPALGAVYGCYEIKAIPVTYVNSLSTITVKCIHCGAIKTGVQFNKIKNMYSQCSCQKAVSTTTN